MSTLHVLAPAKLNLHLDILKKNPKDLRYHLLQSLMVKIDLFDHLSITIDTKRNDYFLEGFLIDRHKDILFKSYEFFRNLTNLTFGLTVNLTKNIPQEAGLGGGSADAGALLGALNEYFNYPIEPQKLIILSKSIGADVPFFLQDAACAIVEGIGEITTPLPSQKITFLLVKPQESMPTAYAFAQLSRYADSLPKSYSNTELENLWITQQYQYFFNDFTSILSHEHPQTHQILLELQRHPGILWANMSGSGTTLFTATSDSHTLEELQQKYHKMGCFSRIVQTI